MVTIAEARTQLEQGRQQAELAKAQAKEAEEQLQQQRAKLPETTSQQALRTKYAGLQGRNIRRQVADVQGKISEKQQEVEKYKGDISKYEEDIGKSEQELESYLQTESGRFQYAKEMGIEPEPVYDRVVKGGAVVVVGYKYNTPYGEVTDYSPKQELLKDMAQLQASELGFSSIKEMEEAQGWTQALGGSSFITEKGKIDFAKGTFMPTEMTVRLDTTTRTTEGLMSPSLISSDKDLNITTSSIKPYGFGITGGTISGNDMGLQYTDIKKSSDVGGSWFANMFQDAKKTKEEIIIGDKTLVSASIPTGTITTGADTTFYEMGKDPNIGGLFDFGQIKFLTDIKKDLETPKTFIYETTGTGKIYNPTLEQVQFQEKVGIKNPIQTYRPSIFEKTIARALPDSVGGIVKTGAYFVPYVGEALLVGEGVIRVYESPTTTGKVLGIAETGLGLFGLNRRLTAPVLNIKEVIIKQPIPQRQLSFIEEKAGQIRASGILANGKAMTVETKGLYGINYQVVAPRQVEVTNPIRDLFGFKPIYSGSYIKDKVGYNQAIDLLENKWKLSTSEARKTIAEIKPRFIKDEFKGSANILSSSEKPIIFISGVRTRTPVKVTLNGYSTLGGKPKVSGISSIGKTGGEIKEVTRYGFVTAEVKKVGNVLRADLTKDTSFVKQLGSRKIGEDNLELYRSFDISRKLGSKTRTSQTGDVIVRTGEPEFKVDYGAPTPPTKIISPKPKTSNIELKEVLGGQVGTILKPKAVSPIIKTSPNIVPITTQQRSITTLAFNPPIIETSTAEPSETISLELKPSLTGSVIRDVSTKSELDIKTTGQTESKLDAQQKVGLKTITERESKLKTDTSIRTDVASKLGLKTAIALKSAIALKVGLVLKTATDIKTTTPIKTTIPSRQPPKYPSKIKPLTISLNQVSKPSAKETVEGLFKVFARTKGEDIEIGEARTLGEAKTKLMKELKGTLRASGFVERAGRRLRAEELGIFGTEFAPSKVDIFRVIQRKGKRLSTRPETREIQLFKRRGGSTWLS